AHAGDLLAGDHSVAEEGDDGFAGQAGELFGQDGSPVMNADWVWPWERPPPGPGLERAGHGRRHDGYARPRSKRRDAGLQLAELAGTAPRAFGKKDYDAATAEPSEGLLDARGTDTLALDRKTTDGTDQAPEDRHEERRT